MASGTESLLGWLLGIGVLALVSLADWLLNRRNWRRWNDRNKR